MKLAPCVPEWSFSQQLFCENVRAALCCVIVLYRVDHSWECSEPKCGFSAECWILNMFLNSAKSVPHFKTVICIQQVARKCVKRVKRGGVSPGRSPLSSSPRFLLTAGSTFSGQPARAWRGICQRSGLNPSRPYSHPPGSVVWESASVYAGLVSRQVCSCLSYWQCWKRRETKRDENINQTLIQTLLILNVKIPYNLVLNHRNYRNTPWIYKPHAR